MSYASRQGRKRENSCVVVVRRKESEGSSVTVDVTKHWSWSHCKRKCCAQNGIIRNLESALCHAV